MRSLAITGTGIAGLGCAHFLHRDYDLNRLNGRLAQSGGFVLHELDDFGPDYARTLRIWPERFAAKRAQVAALGFDERFIRKWTYYLSCCEAAFALRNISMVHTVHTRANNLSP